jgi:hypothetical protein
MADIVFESLNQDNVGGLRILLYGDSNTGKTSFGVSASEHPALQKVGIFNIDENLHTAVGIDNNEFVSKADVKSCLEIENVAKGDLIGKYETYHTWVIDSISRLADYELRDIAQKEYNREPSKRNQDVNQFQDYIPYMAHMTRMLDTLTKGGKHIIITAEEQDTDPDPLSPNAKLRNRAKERRGKMNDALWAMMKYRFTNIWRMNRLNNGDINILVKSFVSPDGRTVYAKTKNSRFLQELCKLEREDARGLGLIRVANANDLNIPQISFSDIYNIWLKATGE